MRVLDLFSGIGGFSLAAHAVGFDTVAFCEIEPYAASILRRHFPGVPVFDDVKELTADALAHAVRKQAHVELCGPVADAERSGRERGEERNGQQEGSSEGADESQRLDVDRRATGERRPRAVGGGGHEEALCLTAGFPCQDISYAGKGAGLDGERSGLFFEVARLIGELGPDYVVLENVAALLTRGLDAVLGTLASLGYDALWACVPACAVGAPHRRDRVWIVAVPEGDNEARLRAMYEHVLSRLTPFGDLAVGQPTATASDAWGSDLDRTGVVGKHNLGLGQAARGDTWPTATTRDWKGACASEVAAGGNGRLDNVVEGMTWSTPRSEGFDAGGGRKHSSLMQEAAWPTPNHRDYKGSPSQAWSGQASLPREIEQDTRDNGSLNPAWVETLMGYPIGYTLPEGEPLVTLPGVWPSDSPDGRGWMTPKSGDGVFASGSTSGRSREMSTHLPTQVKFTQGWPAGLGAEQHEWEPPRLTTDKQHRASRLKTLGNSIVPQVALLWMEAIRGDTPATCEGVQAVKNLKAAEAENNQDRLPLFADGK